MLSKITFLRNDLLLLVSQLVILSAGMLILSSLLKSVILIVENKSVFI